MSDVAQILISMRGKLQTEVEFQLLLIKLIQALNQSPVLNLSEQNLITEDIKNLSNSLKNNTVIKNLNLGYNPSIGYEGTMALCFALKHNTTLMHLDLSFIGVGIRGCIALAKLVKHNKTLISLNISWNLIGKGSVRQYIRPARATKKIIKKSFKPWIKALKYNATLTSLNLSRNELQCLGTSIIGKALLENQGLRRLDLSSNAIWDKGINGLTSVLPAVSNGFIEITFGNNKASESSNLKLNNALTFHFDYIKARMTTTQDAIKNITLPKVVQDLIFEYTHPSLLLSTNLPIK